MSTSNNRLLVELHKLMRDTNQEIINPRIKELQLADLKPLIEMVATARATYLEEMFSLAETQQGEPPSPDQIKHLRHLRIIFEELSYGAKALETAIERDYLEVKK